MKDPLIASLKQLGKTPDAVAKSLKELDITGIPNRENDCPIYHYLLSKGFYPKSVTETDVLTKKEGVNLIYNCHTLPKAVASFVVGFDDNKYQDLIRANPKKKGKEDGMPSLPS